MPTYTFGCAAVDGKPDWLVQSNDNGKEAQEAMALDNNGEPADVHYYQKTNSLSFEAILPADESYEPEIGDVFTYEGVKYYVSGSVKRRTNTDYNRYTLTCKRFTTAGLPA